MGFSSEVNVKWFFFATEHTQIDFKKLKRVLERFDPTKVKLMVSHKLFCAANRHSCPTLGKCLHFLFP